MSNNNQRRVVKEDVPQMRSVRIQSSIPSMQAPPMPLGLGAVSVAPAKLAPTSQTTSGSNAAKVVDKAWKVNQIRPVPSFYKLERTHLKIDDASVEEISLRIADILRQESVYATFNDEEAMVEAETHDGVTFTTRLFAHGNKVVVELQRQAGCCYLFYQTAKAVLRAAKGMEQMKRRTYSIPPSVPKCNDEEEKECLESGLELACGLLKKDRLDAHQLAMESLTQLSRSSKCHCLVAKAILCGPLLDTLVSLIESWTICASDAGMEKGEMEEQHCATMHRLAIAVLANCLTTLETEGELKFVVEQRREQLCSPSLLMALVEELRRAEQRPHDACEAARCLQPLVRTCPECKPRLMDCDCLNATSIAYDAGASSHANLERESRLLKYEIANCN